MLIRYITLCTAYQEIQEQNGYECNKQYPKEIGQSRIWNRLLLSTAHI